MPLERVRLSTRLAARNYTSQSTLMWEEACEWWDALFRQILHQDMIPFCIIATQSALFRKRVEDVAY